jgi:hypothetical protein
MVVWMYEGTGAAQTKRALIDPYAYDSGVKVPINFIWVYESPSGQPATRRLVWSRDPITIQWTSPRWDQIQLSWTAPGSGADTYVVTRADKTGEIYRGPGLTLPTPDGGLTPNTTYSYTVTALRGGQPVESRTTHPTINPPKTLTRAFSASLGAINSVSVVINWTDPIVASVTRYRITRTGNAPVYVNAPLLTWTDNTVAYGTTYTYTVEALRVNEVIAPTPAPLTAVVPTRPAPVISNDAPQWDRINVKWTETVPDASYYVLQRGSTVVADQTNTTGATRSFMDKWLDPSTTYTYTLTARSATGVVLGTATLAGASAPKTAARADMGLTATVTRFDNINVSWTDSSASSDATWYYEVYEGATALWSNYATAGKSFNHAVNPSTSHTYTLYAYRNNPPGSGTWQQMPVSDSASATTGARTFTRHDIVVAASSCGSYTGYPNWTPALSYNANMQHGDATADGSAGPDKANGRASAFVAMGIPANLRNCKAVLHVGVKFRIAYAPNGNAGAWGMALTAQSSDAWPNTWPSGTALFGEYYHAGVDTWLGGSEWINITNAVPTNGPRTVAEEFRVGGKWGICLAPKDNAKNRYGHAYWLGSTHWASPALHFIYETWD